MMNREIRTQAIVRARAGQLSLAPPKHSRVSAIPERRKERIFWKAGPWDFRIYFVEGKTARAH
jgi:hypothetical protein